MHRLKLAWDASKPETRTVLAGLARRIGLPALGTLAREAAAFLAEGSEAHTHAGVRSLVMRQARRFRHELSVTDADVVASFLLSDLESQR